MQPGLDKLTMAITAAEPNGLWGPLKESFAGGTALTQAVTGSAPVRWSNRSSRTFPAGKDEARCEMV